MARVAGGIMVRPRDGVLALATMTRNTALREAPLPLNSLNGKSIVLVGLMGAGKTSIGRRMAAQLGLPFRDADAEIELAAGCTIPEIFSRYGEPAGGR
jgi:shikimate kinase/3-dehydroquinate synthase